MSNYTIRKLGNNEFHLLIPLMKDCFGMDVNLEYFEWKFLKNPAGFVEGFVAISESGEVASFYDVIPEMYVFNGKKTLIYQACDGMTHSAHRRKRLFQKVVTHCYDYLKSNHKLFLIGFGGDKSTPGLLQLGWKHLFNMRYYFYPKLFSSFRQKSDDRNIVEIQDCSEIEDLILKSNASGNIHSDKTRDVFSWRTLNPLYRYKLIAYRSDHENSQYSSYLCYYHLGDKIMIFDWYFQDFHAGKSLTGFLKNKLPGSDFKGIITFCKEDSKYSKEIRMQGFISNPFKKGPLSARAPFIIYTNEEDMKTDAAPENWLINSFDHDAM